MTACSRTNVMGTVEWALLLILSMLWGGSFFFVGIALDDLPPLTVVLGRVLLGALALNAIVLATGQRMPRSAGVWGSFLVLGAVNNFIPFSLISWSQTRIDSGLAAILTATTPLFTVVLAHFLTGDERMTAARAAGVVIGFTGVTVMIGVGALQGLSGQVVAQLAVVGATLGYASAGIYGRRFRQTPPLVVAAGQLTAATVLMVPAAAVVDRPWALDAPGLDTVGAVLALALFSTALAYVIAFRILAVAGATNLVLVTFLIPVTALLLGTTFLGESFGLQHLAGMALIGLGLAAIDGRLLAKVRGRLRPQAVNVETGEAG